MAATKKTKKQATADYDASKIKVHRGARGGPQAPRDVHRHNRQPMVFTTWSTRS